MFRRAIEAAAGAESLVWDITWGLRATPQGPVTEIWCTVHCANPAQLGNVIPLVFTMPLNAREEHITAMARTQVEALLTRRSEALACLNGHEAPRPGLIIPD